jgi:uncharacterized SAM-binding protein YcdF (DUF218 family)
MWVLTKIVSRILFPVPLCLEVFLVGLLLLCFTRKQKTGKTLVALGATLLFLFSSHPVSDRLLAPLEKRYPPLSISSGAPLAVRLGQVKFIVVLGSGFAPDPNCPVQMQFDDGSIARLVEGVRVVKVLSGCKLIVSGAPEREGAPLMAQAMAQLAQGLGVGRQDIILDGNSPDTEAEARNISPVVGKQPFILVTEASHMPRALALFRKQGTDPIADPTDYRADRDQSFLPQDLIPDAGGLAGSERAVYEYLGLAWVKVRGRI